MFGFSFYISLPELKTINNMETLSKKFVVEKVEERADNGTKHSEQVTLQAEDATISLSITDKDAFGSFAEKEEYEMTLTPIEAEEADSDEDEETKD